MLTRHELPGEVLRRGRLERVQNDVSVQRVSRHDAPVVKHLRAERLALRAPASKEKKTATHNAENKLAEKNKKQEQEVQKLKRRALCKF